MLRRKLLILLLIIGMGDSFGQSNFFIKDNRKSAKIKFELVNNLIIVPVELNGLELSFLVDTGVKTTVLLNLDKEDSLELKATEKIHLRGLGGEELIEAFKSSGNRMRIGKVENPALALFVIYDEDINFSPRLGVPVHGIIGYDLFKDFVVEINYQRKFLRLHDPLKFEKRLKGYERIPLTFFQDKPYVTTTVNVQGQEAEAKFLLDNGLSDAIWLFPGNKNIPVPQEGFYDFLGLGLLGDVMGKRGRIDALNFGSYEMRNISASFPDSLSVEGLQTYHDRNGSIGGETLRRFHVIFDYPNKQLFLRKNRWFNEGFHYDMSGIVLEHSGFVVVESYEKLIDNSSSGQIEEDNVLVMEPSFYRKYELQPAFRIARLREGSPALLAGLREGDELVKVNGKRAFKMELDDFTSLFSSKEGKRIKMKVQRGGRILDFRFNLKDPVK